MNIRSACIFLLLTEAACHPAWEGDGDHDTFVRPSSPSAPRSPGIPAPPPARATAESVPIDVDAVEIVLTRAASGAVPEHTVAIESDGRVRFHKAGPAGSALEASARIPLGAVQTLLRDFEDAGFLDPRVGGLESVPGAPSILLEVRDGVREFRVAGHRQSPSATLPQLGMSSLDLDERCAALALEIDRAVDVDRWLGRGDAR